ncbi:MAG TPA: hypothetical protein DCP69_09275 [Candidatus Omnitrophica bacterium]|nr:hypothetical protein [Candidatus Omnitrophota bacterium]
MVIGPSNVGDGVLMSPVVHEVRQAFPEARLTLLVGERARAVFESDLRIHRLVSFEEFDGLVGRLRLVRWVWRLRPDAMVDLRQTILPLLWRPWRALAYFWPVPRRIVHMRDRHLWRLQRQVQAMRLRQATSDKGQATSEWDGGSLGLTNEEIASVERLMKTWAVDGQTPLVVISPGARSHIKRWYPERLASMADRLIEECRAAVVFTGEPDEAALVTDLLKTMRHRAHNAAGRLTLRQTAALMQRARLVMTNDSAALHLACAVDVPVLALFGPTDPRKYGPTGPRDRVIRRRLVCAPCEQPLCRFHHECMRFISEHEVYAAAKDLLGQGT